MDRIEKKHVAAFVLIVAVLMVAYHKFKKPSLVIDEVQDNGVTTKKLNIAKGLGLASLVSLVIVGVWIYLGKNKLSMGCSSGYGKMGMDEGQMCNVCSF